MSLIDFKNDINQVIQVIKELYNRLIYFLVNYFTVVITHNSSIIIDSTGRHNSLYNHSMESVINALKERDENAN